jgi:EthD domain
MSTFHYGVLLRRSATLSHDDFLKTWLGPHRGLAEGLPGLVTARFLPGTEVSGFPLAYDGLGLLSFTSPEEALTAFASETGQQLRSHTATFAQSDQAIRQFFTEPS